MYPGAWPSQGHRQRVLLFNLTAQPQIVHIQGLAGKTRARYLDEGNALWAMQSPEAYHKAGETILPMTGKLELQPYAVVRLDIA